MSRLSSPSFQAVLRQSGSCRRDAKTTNGCDATCLPCPRPAERTTTACGAQWAAEHAQKTAAEVAKRPAWQGLNATLAMARQPEPPPELRQPEPQPEPQQSRSRAMTTGQMLGSGPPYLPGSGGAVEEDAIQRALGRAAATLRSGTPAAVWSSQMAAAWDAQPVSVSALGAGFDASYYNRLQAVDAQAAALASNPLPAEPLSEDGEIARALAAWCPPSSSAPLACQMARVGRPYIRLWLRCAYA
jgi:hypothetical protein